ncbi:interleukin-32-like isoform X2 [Bubalus kerabau]|uniref:interleukin-32-like isoform X2 n=1 Tax=Bubalus carabanensis TaxID=3119969 RepID=UPI00244EB446|nr:interleukin-32-like isoform X2 [Bubalus carabanensis]
MCFAKGLSGNLASLRDMMHKRVDDFCDKMRNEPEGAQMEAALAEMEESSPFLPEARQEVRRRIQRPSVSACPEVQNPQESIWARALRWFEGILQRLKQRCWDALTWLREKAVPWLKEKAAACLEAICSAVKAVWGMLTDFCSTVGQLFRILIQV